MGVVDRIRGLVLVADPEPSGREHLRRALSTCGFLAYGSASRAESIALVNDLAVDFAVLDSYFPDGSGLATCAALRALARPPVVILTTWDPLREFRRDALSAGVHAVVPKPLRPALIVATIEAALRREGHAFRPYGHCE